MAINSKQALKMRKSFVHKI